MDQTSKIKEQRILLSMRNDDKVAKLSAAGEEFSFKIISSPYKWNVLFPVFFIIFSIKNCKPNGIIVRYLNDSNNLVRSCILFMSLLLTIGLAVILRVRIFWFLHNIDKESEEHFPLMIKVQRKLVGDLSYVIFVMDPLLIKIAKHKYPKWQNKFDYISFGARATYSGLKTNDEFLNHKFIDFVANNSEDKVFIGFCPTAPSEKCVHLNYARSLVEHASNNGITIKLIVFGDLKNFLQENPQLAKDLTHKQIYLLDRFIEYNPGELAKYFDFYWRSLSDESISYTLYEAATIAKPIISMDIGFVGKAVEYYKLGFTINLNFTDLSSAFCKLKSWDRGAAQLFLESHSWENAGRRISMHL
jgi:glycosyltransferase involved in cell wall biosynthesis